MNTYVKNGFLSLLIACNGAAFLTPTKVHAIDTLSSVLACMAAGTGFYLVDGFLTVKKAAKETKYLVTENLEKALTYGEIIGKQRAILETLEEKERASVLKKASFLYAHWQGVVIGTVAACCLWANREAIVAWSKKKIGYGTQKVAPTQESVVSVEECVAPVGV